MAIDVIIRPATEADADLLDSEIRREDYNEVLADTGCEPSYVLKRSLNSSGESWSVLFDGNLVGIWGVEPYRESVLGGRSGYVWLLTSTWVEKYRKSFHRVTRDILEVLLYRWDVLIGAFDCRYERAIAWGRRLGFQFNDPGSRGLDGLDFVTYTVSRKDLPWVSV